MVAKGGDTAERFAGSRAVEHALGAVLQHDDARCTGLYADGRDAAISHGGWEAVTLAAGYGTPSPARVDTVQVIEHVVVRADFLLGGEHAFFRSGAEPGVVLRFANHPRRLCLRLAHDAGTGIAAAFDVPAGAGSGQDR